MRKLDQDEQQFIGVLAIMTLIIGTIFSTIFDLDKEPLHQWAIHILAEKPPNIGEAIAQFLIWSLQPLLILPCLKPTTKLLEYLGFQIKIPNRWIPILKKDVMKR